MTRSAPFIADYWSLQYAVREDGEATYRITIESHDDPIERVRAFWDWKYLSQAATLRL